MIDASSSDNTVSLLKVLKRFRIVSAEAAYMFVLPADCIVENPPGTNFNQQCIAVMIHDCGDRLCPLNGVKDMTVQAVYEIFGVRIGQELSINIRQICLR